MGRERVLGKRLRHEPGSVLGNRPPRSKRRGPRVPSRTHGRVRGVEERDKPRCSQYWEARVEREVHLHGSYAKSYQG